MADKYMIGINNLRKLSRDVNTSPLWMCLRLEREGDWGGRSNAIRLPNVLRELADQIEREHAEELAAAKRDLTDEAREAVERLHAVSHENVMRSTNHALAAFDELCNAVGVIRGMTYTGTLDAICNRIIELIEHGGKRDADVAALRELADEVQDAIMAELDKRLMPPGMAWPRWDDGRQVSHYDTLEDATAICLALDGSCYSLHYDMPDGERVCLFDGSERIKRPEPEVLGADGEPIRKGETVYDVATGDRYTVFGLPPFNNGPVRLNGYRNSAISSCNLTHTRPETQKLIDKQSKMHPLAYCRYVLKWDGEDVKRTDDVDCGRAMTADLLRRQRELDAKTTGGE